MAQNNRKRTKSLSISESYDTSKKEIPAAEPESALKMIHTSEKSESPDGVQLLMLKHAGGRFN